MAGSSPAMTIPVNLCRAVCGFDCLRRCWHAWPEGRFMDRAAAQHQRSLRASAVPISLPHAPADRAGWRNTNSTWRGPTRLAFVCMQLRFFNTEKKQEPQRATEFVMHATPEAQTRVTFIESRV